MSAHLLIAQALAAALLVAPALAGGYVRANPTGPAEQGRNAAVAVRQASTVEISVSPCARLWQTVYEIELAARSNTGADPAVAVDALLDAAWARIAEADLSALGVRDLLIGPQIGWEYDAADTPVASATLRLTVEHYTERASLQVPAL